MNIKDWIAKSTLILVVWLCLLACSPEEWDSPIGICMAEQDINPNHPKADALQALMDRYVGLGLPGAAVAIHTPDGFWSGAAGYAKIEDKTAMEPCNLQYSQSVAKTYLAVAVLRLYEDDLLELDASIEQYLPANVKELLPDLDDITVRMLLNHTSGLPEYNGQAAYVTYLLQHPMHEFSPLDYLGFVEGKPLAFVPGSKYRYTNTNYVVLALMADAMTGDHTAYLRQEVFEKAQLTRSFYHDSPDFLDQPEMVNSYWDRYSNRALENCSEMQKTNVKTLIGDDGIVATPLDYVRFSKSLFDGDLLRPETMELMLSFANTDHQEFSYGLGLHESFYKGYPEYGHSGGGIGAGCYLAYFPDFDTHVFIAINIGTIIYSPLFDELESLQNELFDVVME